MGYQVLALKWRPRDFSAVVGQQATLTSLQHALDQQQVHHAYLFTGTRGVGKTTLARILAKSLNCVQGISSQPCGECINCTSIDAGDCVDVLEVDAASRTKVEDTRELLDNIAYTPLQARFKIYIIDEVHMLSNHSFNALLKTLEEPPAHVKFILATTDPQKLPITVLSRCLQYHLRNLTIPEISQRLAYILNAEQINFAAQALTHIAECANGSMRDALSLLEQVIAFGQGAVTLDAAQQILGTSLRAQTLQLLQQIVLAEPRAALTTVRGLAANNADFNQVLKTLQHLLYQTTLLQIVPEAVVQENLPEYTELVNLAAQASPLDLQLCYQTSLQGVRDLPYAPSILVGFEMLVLRMIAFQQIQADSVVAEPVISVPVTNIVAPVPITPAPAVTTPVTTNNWAQVISQLNLVGLTKVIAENCVVTQWQDDVIELTLHEDQKALLNAKHTERIQEALQQHLNKKIKLTIKVSALQTETPAAQGQRLQQAAQQAAEESIRTDKHIQEFTQAFAARITDINLNEK